MVMDVIICYEVNKEICRYIQRFSEFRQFVLVRNNLGVRVIFHNSGEHS